MFLKVKHTNLNRNFIGMEINETYFNKAKERILNKNMK